MIERKKTLFIILLILAIWLPAQTAYAKDDKDRKINMPETEQTLWRDLNQRSDKILTYIREGHIEEANHLLNDFSKSFLDIRASDYHLTMKELQVITATFDEVKAATVSVSMSHEERIRKGLTLRLLVDVYEKSFEPLWKKTKSSLFEPLKNMESALKEDDIDLFKNELGHFIYEYETIRPAWSVSLPSIQYEKADAQVQYLLHIRRNAQSKQDVLAHLQLLKEHFQNIFDGKEEDTADPQLIWVMMTISGAILSALTYAGWKKYQAEKEKERQAEQKRRRLY